MTAEGLIRILEMKPLPREGGYYRETYRSRLTLPADSLGGMYNGPRAAATAIYYLLTPETFSALHRLRGDELFHFYLGDPVEMLLLESAGSGRWLTLGTDFASGQQPQVMVPAGVWQGSRLRAGGAFALLGTTMAPGFEFADFEAGKREELQTEYPAFSTWIEELTRE